MAPRVLMAWPVSVSLFLARFTPSCREAYRYVGFSQVAEKPAIALTIASTLARGQMLTRRGSTEVHEFDDFPKEYQDWTVTDPLDLFGAQIVQGETNPKAHICRHLSIEARGCHDLVLWLDCDREGENICFEVMNCTGFDSGDAGKMVYRARFSSVTESDILRAMDNLVQPNRNESLAVDARQEIDLKVGVSFTRFQTNYFHGKYARLDSRIISYGPCQTPTLGFCVQRHVHIVTFKPEKYWSVQPRFVHAGYELCLEWERGKIYDLDVAQLYQKLVTREGFVQVKCISEHAGTKSRPSGLNTVNLLKVASSAYGCGPQLAMQICERLYTQGYISYPRTESTAYPSSFDFNAALRAQTRNRSWGAHAQALLDCGFLPPRAGKDVGDHPPITPTRAATEDALHTDAWRLYEYICRHFIGSVSPDCHYTRTKVEFSAAEESFSVVGKKVVSPGFITVMPWLAVEEKRIPAFSVGTRLKPQRVDLHEGTTGPPDYLTESELISMMEKNGIGTDASIPVHVNNICERNFVRVESGRRLVPTALGVSLIRGYQLIDPDLYLPNIRGFIEQQITLVAKGQADHVPVVRHVLRQFQLKYSYFVKHIDEMDTLFEAHFSPAADSGRALSRCGKCMRYMKYVSSHPPRLYCGTCEEVYRVPPKGTLKLYKGITCPLDNFELVLFDGGPSSSPSPLCPFCYSNPPFEDAGGAGMECSRCVHPTCPHSAVSRGVCTCPECGGTLVLDPLRVPGWRLRCNSCRCLVHLPPGLHRVSATGDACPHCRSALLLFDFNRKTNPLGDASTTTLHTACLLCDDFIHSLLTVDHARSIRRHRHLARKSYDPKMSFRDF